MVFLYTMQGRDGKIYVLNVSRTPALPHATHSDQGGQHHYHQLYFKDSEVMSQKSQSNVERHAGVNPSHYLRSPCLRLTAWSATRHPHKKIVWLEAKSIYPKICNVVLCDLRQAKVKDDLNNWAGRGTVDRESTREQNGLTVLESQRVGGRRKRWL